MKREARRSIRDLPQDDIYRLREITVVRTEYVCMSEPAYLKITKLGRKEG